MDEFAYYTLIMIGVVFIIAGAVTFYTYSPYWSQCSEHAISISETTDQDIENASIENFSSLSSNQRSDFIDRLQNNSRHANESIYNLWENETYVRFNGTIYSVEQTTIHCPGTGFVDQVLRAIGVLIFLIGISIVLYSKRQELN